MSDRLEMGIAVMTSDMRFEDLPCTGDPDGGPSGMCLYAGTKKRIRINAYQCAPLQSYPSSARSVETTHDFLSQGEGEMWKASMAMILRRK